MKYLNRYPTKAAFIYDIKHAEANKLFFSKDTMRFFGSQTFTTDGDVFVVHFHDRDRGAPRTARYTVDPTTLKLSPEPRATSTQPEAPLPLEPTP